MKCLICGQKCHKQMTLDGKKAPHYPNLCPTCNTRRKNEYLIMAKDGTRYAFVPTERIAEETKEVVNILMPKCHPKNFWLVPESMIETCLAKVYPLTDDEKETKKRIKRLREEKENLECEIYDIENRIEELERELPYNPDREIKATWLLKVAPEVRAEVMG